MSERSSMWLTAVVAVAAFCVAFIAMALFCESQVKEWNRQLVEFGRPASSTNAPR